MDLFLEYVNNGAIQSITSIVTLQYLASFLQFYEIPTGYGLSSINNYAGIA